LQILSKALAFVAGAVLLCGQAWAQDAVSLASRLPAVSASNHQDPPSNRNTNIFTGQDANRGIYNLQLLAATAAVASDDTGLHKTLYTSPGSTAYRISSDVTKLGDPLYTAPLLGAVYLAGGKRNQTLAWHAAVAVVDASVVGEVLKYAVGRHRPIGASGGGNADRFSPGNTSEDGTAFPSGHTLVAFSVASVWAHDKPREKFLAYGLATLVGISRITLSAHWPSDVLVGAVIGIAQGRQVSNGNTSLFSIRF